MKEFLLQTLQANREQIRSRWETLLRIEPVPSPLARPDVLSHLFDETFAEVLERLKSAPRRPIRARPAAACDCNPMRAYFPALEQAMLESVVLAQAGQPGLAPEERSADVSSLAHVLRYIARRELRLYDALCQKSRPLQR